MNHPEKSRSVPSPKFHVGQTVLYRDGLAIVYGYIVVGSLILYDLVPPDAERFQDFGDFQVRGNYYASEARLIPLPDIAELQ